MSDTGCTALILAAGKGERMKSPKHKILSDICGSTVIDCVLDAVGGRCEKPILVVSHQMEQVRGHLGDSVEYVYQDPAAGWGTAMPIKAARGLLAQRGGLVLVCHGDTPLISRDSVARLIQAVKDGADAAMLTAVAADPKGYGRVIREAGGSVTGIVEEKDATDAQRAITEINASTYCFKARALLSVIDDIKNDNAKGEYYLTDAVGLLWQKGCSISAVVAGDAAEGQGVNNMADLAAACALMRQRINHEHMLAGVRMTDPQSVYIDRDVKIGSGTVVYPGCVLERGTEIGENVTLLPGCRIAGSRVGDGCTVESSVILESVIGDGTTVGPHAYVRPGSAIGAHCRIGDFVEIKNAVIGDGTKVAHLAYVGDADLGCDINISCGVVFANYDGKHKRRSRVGDRAFIGCNSNIVAPITIGEDAYVAAGSTVTIDVAPGCLCVARAREAVKEGWVYKRRSEGRL